MTSRNHSSSSKQFGLSVRRGMLCERPTPAQFSREQWKHAECVRTSYPGLENHLKVLPHSPPIRAGNHYSSVKSNQLTSRSSVLASMLHPDQFERRPVEPARVLYSGKYHHHRYHPYWIYVLQKIKTSRCFQFKVVIEKSFNYWNKAT